MHPVASGPAERGGAEEFDGDKGFLPHHSFADGGTRRCAPAGFGWQYSFTTLRKNSIGSRSLPGLPE
jgi:hypothetical protein